MQGKHLILPRLNWVILKKKSAWKGKLLNSNFHGTGKNINWNGILICKRHGMQLVLRSCRSYDHEARVCSLTSSQDWVNVATFLSTPCVLTTGLNHAHSCRLPSEEPLGAFLPLSSLCCAFLHQCMIKWVGALLARTAAHRMRTHAGDGAQPFQPLGSCGLCPFTIGCWVSLEIKVAKYAKAFRNTAEFHILPYPSAPYPDKVARAQWPLLRAHTETSQRQWEPAWNRKASCGESSGIEITFQDRETLGGPSIQAVAETCKQTTPTRPPQPWVNSFKPQLYMVPPGFPMTVRISRDLGLETNSLGTA